MFKRSEQVDTWFQNIDKKAPFSTKLDQWYVCALAGLLNGRLDSPPDTIDIFPNFTADYQASRRIIVGLLIAAEMKRHNVASSDRDDIQRLLDALIDPDNESKLTDDGFDKLNKYSYAGFCLLQEEYGGRPESPEDFLQFYCRELAQWESVQGL